MFISRPPDARPSWASDRGRDPRGVAARPSPGRRNVHGFVRSTRVGHLADHPHDCRDPVGRGRRLPESGHKWPSARPTQSAALRAPSAASPSMDPAMQRLLDRAREPSAAWNKLTPSVQEAARSGTGTFRVAIFTDDVNTLGAFLRKDGEPTPIGSVPTTRSGVRVVTMDVPTRLLEKVAALDHVYSIAPAVLPAAPDRVETGASALNAIRS